MADGAAVAILVNVTPGLDDFADETVVDEFHVANQRGVRTILCSMLDDAPILLCRSNHLSPFVDAVRHRLLDIHILACLAGPNSRECVPMIRRRDSYGVDFR